MLRCLLLLLLIAPAAQAQRQADTLIIHFAFDHSDIRPADSATLNHINQTADSILIIGYTDTTGSNAYNENLSYRRALATQNALQRLFTQTLSAAQAAPIRLDPRGESNPLPGDDSLSRRVEIILYTQIKDTVRSVPVVAERIKPDDEPDTVFGLDNINFIANTPTLTDAARLALPGNVAYLKSYSNRYIEIDGFCNQPGPPLKPADPLFILSVKRAKFIYDHLIQNGFDSTHLRYKGLGNASPVNAHPTTAAEMDQNMRVEIRVFSHPQKQQ